MSCHIYIQLRAILGIQVKMMWVISNEEALGIFPRVQQEYMRGDKIVLVDGADNEN